MKPDLDGGKDRDRGRRQAFNRLRNGLVHERVRHHLLLFPHLVGEAGPEMGLRVPDIAAAHHRRDEREGRDGREDARDRLDDLDRPDKAAEEPEPRGRHARRPEEDEDGHILPPGHAIEPCDPVRLRQEPVLDIGHVGRTNSRQVEDQLEDRDTGEPADVGKRHADDGLCHLGAAPPVVGARSQPHPGGDRQQHAHGPGERREIDEQDDGAEEEKDGGCPDEFLLVYLGHWTCVGHGIRSERCQRILCDSEARQAQKIATFRAYGCPADGVTGAGIGSGGWFCRCG